MQQITWPLTLRHYQETGVDYACTLRVKSKPDLLFNDCARSLNSDAPGAGKSLQASTAADRMVPSDSSICVITPAHLVSQWFTFLCNQYPDDNVVSIEGTKSQRTRYANTPSRWYIISTQSLRSKAYFEMMQQLYIRQHINFTIIDESHYVKNRDAKQSHYVRELCEPQFCKHVMLLSATPIMREADDLWHQLRIIDPIEFKSLDRFLNTYCWFSWTSWGAQNVTLRKGAQEILQATKLPRDSTNNTGNQINQTYDNSTGWILGRSYSEIGLELPRLIAPDPILVQFTPARRKMYEDIKWTWAASFNDGDDTFNANSAMEVMHTLRRIINSPEKQEQITNYLTDDVGPFFIVCDYKWSCRDVANAINTKFPGNEYRTTVITGEIDSSIRIELAKQNSQNPNDIIIATMGSIPEGADLSSCSTVYFYEQATTPGRMHQVLSRVRRHRQSSNTGNNNTVIITEDNRLLLPDINANERPVMCRYFHVERTLDQRIHEVCFNRAINIKDIIKVELQS